MKYIFLVLVALFFTSALFAIEGNVLYAGPEVYRMKRWRNGGTRQSGRIDALKVGFDRVKPFKVYLGGEALFAEGTLKGHSRRGSRLKSDLYDRIYEGRLGFTFGDKKHYFVPFGGGGTFTEINSFIAPSPFSFCFQETLDFYTIGFLSGLNFTSQLSIGINFKTRFMANGKSKVTEDPDFPDISLVMNNESQYRLEIPINYLPTTSCVGGEIAFFYEHRHFGGRQGFPFDFLDTKFDLLGMRFAFTYGF